MVDLNKALSENRRSAVSALKCVSGNFVEFDSDEDNNFENDTRPFVLIVDRYNNIYNLPIAKAHLNENGKMEIYVKEWGEWTSDDECLSTTANNVYEAITKQIFG